MFFKRLAPQIRSCVVRVVWKIEQRIKQWTQPAKTNQVVNTLSDLKRSQCELIAENMFLR